MTGLDYRPEDHGVGIVHIGPGAFHRAHQAVYTDDALARMGGDWRIDGVSLRSTNIADALNAQNGEYTLVVTGKGAKKYRKIRSIRQIYAASRDMAAARAAMRRPGVKIISLTVTEKAYTLPDGQVPENHAISVLVDALAGRREDQLGPLTLLSCDNLPDNGSVLRRATLELAARRDQALADWIAETCSFPSSMVDRITPATTDALLRDVAQQTGWEDKAPVQTEAFSQWVVEDQFVQGRPEWEGAGVALVEDVSPYERMKLFMLNGAHSMLAYAGFMAGCAYVRDTMADAALHRLINRHMMAAAATLEPLQGVDYGDYARALLARFANPEIDHATYQIAMDGSQKMPQRIFAPALIALERGQPLAPYAFASAAWLAYLTGKRADGTAFELRDPREAELSRLPAEAHDRVDALFALPNLVPSALAAAPEFRSGVVAVLQAIQTVGMPAAIEEAAA
ncbi:MAG: mannitol dehydrogenase family protein [Neomegalonema sp.]|nr:mannitol dehydrogenase family protein [Neomegalonema sp.]